MTQHQTNIQAVEAVPPLDASAESVAALPATFPDGINPNWDVAKLATRGHVLIARSEVFTKRYAPVAKVAMVAAFGSMIMGFIPSDWRILAYVPTMLLVILIPLLDDFGGYSIRRRAALSAFLTVLVWLGMGVLLSNGRTTFPSVITNALTFDQDSYFDLGGGLKGGPDVAWLSKYAPKPESLSEGDYAALVKATAADMQQHGTDAANWATVGGLKVQPIVTRPEKVFAKNADKLKDGVISIPEGSDIVDIVAHVKGQWAIAKVAGGRCATFQGPAIDGCQAREDGAQGDRLNDTAREALAAMKPTETKE